LKRAALPKGGDNRFTLDGEVITLAKNKNNKAAQNNKFNAEFAQEFNQNNAAANKVNQKANQQNQQNQQ